MADETSESLVRRETTWQVSRPGSHDEIGCSGTKLDQLRREMPTTSSISPENTTRKGKRGAMRSDARFV